MRQIIQDYNSKFFEIVKNYDCKNSNILRKLIHSFSVAEKCYSIACSKGLSNKKRNLCYLIGLFHDIGRFEQWKKYGTYDDKKSIDHADLSCEIIDSLNFEENFGITQKELIIIKESIKYHTKPYTGKNKEILLFNYILNNADAYANVITTANGMQPMTCVNNGVTPEFVQKFRNRELLKISPNTKLDICLALTACCYYVKDKTLREEIIKFKYIDIIFETFSKHLNNEDKKTYKTLINQLKDKY